MISAPRDEWASMGPGDNSNPGVYFLIGSGTPTRSGVYLDPALNGLNFTVRKPKTIIMCVCVCAGHVIPQ